MTAPCVLRSDAIESSLVCSLVMMWANRQDDHLFGHITAIVYIYIYIYIAHYIYSMHGRQIEH